jgi:hypothetical protein
MDLTHIVLIFVLLATLAMVIYAYRTTTQLLKRDEAIDAATFLALRQLDEYVKSTRQAPPRPG